MNERFIVAFHVIDSDVCIREKSARMGNEHGGTFHTDLVRRKADGMDNKEAVEDR